MCHKKCFFIPILTLIVQISLAAQTQIAVPLGDPVYYVLEQAQLRGLCPSLPGAKPYSRTIIISTIEEIIRNSNDGRRFSRLTEFERRVLDQFLQNFSPRKKGLDLAHGTFFADHLWHNIYFSAEIGVGLDFNFAGGVFSKAGGYRYDPATDDPGFAGASHPKTGDGYFDADMGLNVSFFGNLGRNTSYGINISGRVFRSPRAVLGAYQNFWDGFVEDPGDPESMKRPITSYSEPLAYFPYTYKKHWDGFVWGVSNISNNGQLAWPEGVSIGYTFQPELAGTFLKGHVFYRFARLDREWGGMTTNGSLVLNQSAQPFLALETTIVPFRWISLSALTGVLEYNNAIGADNSPGMVTTAKVNQNAFSMLMLELNIKNYVHLDFGSSVVWPKRFELGYLFPFMDNFLYQNNIGDFDNLALFLNLQGQYPGLAKLWFSLFLDEANPEKNFFSLDKMMYAFQFGGSANIPWLPFCSVTVSYTKVEPYTYTHTRKTFPWYDAKTLMETNYVNSGRSLGYYLPPNSDEILIRFETVPFPQSMFSFQYQLIRHGADYGDRAVDGSSLWSELDPAGRSENPALRKYFLHDGAYQWMHVIKLGGAYSFTSYKVPVKLIGEIGCVYSYFTDVEGIPNEGIRKPNRVINTAQYPKEFRFIMLLGIQIFPKF